VASYTPLFYVLAASLQAVIGPGFASGRGLALVCLAVAAALVGILAADKERRPRVAFMAAVLFLALGIPGSGPLPWSALYKEDSLALALALGSLVLLTLSPASTGSVVAAGALSA
jgi:hypothetical protein